MSAAAYVERYIGGLFFVFLFTKQMATKAHLFTQTKVDEEMESGAHSRRDLLYLKWF